MSMKTIIKNKENEITIKKSKFIGMVKKIENEEDINIILNELKIKYKDSNHICYAYTLDNKKKYSDDKEPKGTAGLPILNVLEWEKLINVMAVVVRYFGGTLLWVGWLIQAYTQATKDAIANCNIVEKEILKNFELIHEYSQTSLVAHLMEKYDIKLISEVCDDKSKKVLTINLGLISDFEKELFESSNWQLKITNL